MPLSSMHYFPLAWPFLLALFALFAIVVMLIELDILKYAYARMGIPPRYILAILLLTLLGSSINIPLAHFPQERVVSREVVHSFGMRYVVPVVREWPGTVLAINVGGALIPIVLSIYLTLKNRLLAPGLIAVAVVALVTHQLARPVRGVGITVPLFLPPVIAALVALLLSWRRAAPLAYIAGSIGTLVGADLLNLGKVRGLGAPVASIGGAGTFDGVFLVGIVAVLLASLIQPRSAADMQRPRRV
jgi:uncharacterized membrane protein